MYAYVVVWQFGFIPIHPTNMYRMLLYNYFFLKEAGFFLNT